MKALILTSQALLPNSRFGGSRRLYSMVRELATRHEIHVISVDVAGEWDSRKTDHPFASMACLPYRKEASLWHNLTALPFDGSGIWYSEFEKALASLPVPDFDAVFLAYPFVLPALRSSRISGHRNLTYLEDDLFLELTRKRAHDTGAGLGQSLFRRLKYRQARRFYKKILRPVRKFIAISPQERAIAGDLFPHLQIQTIGHCLAIEDHPILPRPSDPRTLGFIGNFRHLPNREGILHFLEHTYPRARKAVSGLKLLVAGMSIPEEWPTAFENDPSVSWQPNLESLEDFYGRISIMINHAVSGRGLRTKVVEAAAFGRPVLSTSLGAEGLEEMQIPVYSDAATFIAQCEKVIFEPDWYSRVVTTNREIVQERFSSLPCSRQLEKVLFH